MDVLTALRLQNLFTSPQQTPGTQGVINPNISPGLINQVDANGNLPSFQEQGNFPMPNDPSIGTGRGPGANQFMNQSIDNNDEQNDDTTAPLPYKSTLSDRLADTLSNMPQRPQPSKFQSIAAAIAGFGAGGSPAGIVGGQPIGYRFNPQANAVAADQVKYGDYDNQVADWTNKVKALATGATEEDKANANTRLTNYGIENQRLKGTQQNINQQRADIAQQRADDARDKAIEETKRKADDAQKKLEFAEKEATRKQGDFETLSKLNQAKLDAMNSQHDLDRAQRDKALDEQKRKNDAVIESIMNKNLPKEKQVKVQRDKGGNITGVNTITGNAPATKPSDPLGIRPEGDDD